MQKPCLGFLVRWWKYPLCHAVAILADNSGKRLWFLPECHFILGWKSGSFAQCLKGILKWGWALQLASLFVLVVWLWLLLILTWVESNWVMCSFWVTYTPALSPLSRYDLIRSCKLQKGWAWPVCLGGMLLGATQDAKGNGAGDSVNAALPSESATAQNLQPPGKGTELVPCRRDGVGNLKSSHLVLIKDLLGRLVAFAHILWRCARKCLLLI